MVIDVKKSDFGGVIIEGKTKQIYGLKNLKHDGCPLVYVMSKDRITAGDGVKAHELKDKGRLSTQTNCAIFNYLNAIGIQTHFVCEDKNNPNGFIAKECSMIPIEWVSRRVATGSYLRRNPNIKEGYRFAPVKLETFFKDDENHDPYWSTDSIIEAKLVIGNLLITRHHVLEMLKITELVFEVLEKGWATVDHALIDMKIEFGVINTNNGPQIVLADVIDNDSWRLWPGGDKRLMLDKQVYRNLNSDEIDETALLNVKSKFETVAERTKRLFLSLVPPEEANLSTPEVAILLGSPVDLEFAEKIRTQLKKLGVRSVAIHVCSAHKSVTYCLEVVAELTQWPTCKAIIACAGLSNGLGPVSASNTTIPVISCPPTTDLTALQMDIWSSIRLPSGLGTSLVLGAGQAAQAAAHIVATGSSFVWSKIRTQQAYNYIKIIHEDTKLDD